MTAPQPRALTAPSSILADCLALGFARMSEGNSAVMTPGGHVFGRESLAADRVLYVSNDGNDGNDGETEETAFLTVQHAANRAAYGFALNGYSIDIHVAAGLYDEAVNLPGYTGGTLSFVGDVGAPANVEIAPTVGEPGGAAVSCIEPSNDWHFSGFRFSSPSVAFSTVIRASKGGGIRMVGASEIKSNVASAIGLSSSLGGRVIWDYDAPMTVIGDAWNRIMMANDPGSFIDCEPITLTITGLCDIAEAFITAAFPGSLIYFYYDTLVGAATGKRYDVDLLALINTFGGGASYVPGDVPGTADAGSFALCI